MRLITTLKKIRSESPCPAGWAKLLAYLDKTQADDEPLDLITVLESNGILDACWCLRCFEYRDYCLFLADIAESVLPIIEASGPEENRPDLAIQAIRDYKQGLFYEERLIYISSDVAGAATVAGAAGAADNPCAAYYVADLAADIATDREEQIAIMADLFIKHFGETNDIHSTTG